MRSRRRVLRAIATLLVFGVLAVVAYNAIAARMVLRHDQRVERNPDTGILAGAEPQDLGPEQAEIAILLVHGFLGAGNNFGDLPERLAAEGYRVRVMLLPGHGTSPRDLAVTEPDELMDAVLAEYRVLHETHDGVILAGHSMGGALATLAASTERPAGLVLAAPYFGVTHQWYYGLRPETWSRISGSVIRWVYKGDRFIRVKRNEAKDDIVSYRWVPSNGTRILTLYGERARKPEVLSDIHCPVLMLHSRDDFAASPQRAESAFDALASSVKELVWLPDSDHHIFWDYDREMAVQKVVEFVNRIAIHGDARVSREENRLQR